MCWGSSGGRLRNPGLRRVFSGGKASLEGVFLGVEYDEVREGVV